MSKSMFCIPVKSGVDPQCPVIFNAALADTCSQRLVGLLKYQSIADDSALILMRCNSVHTVGMRFPIDVVFLDCKGNVLGIVEALRPFRFTILRHATTVLECNSYFAKRSGLRVGTRLHWSV